MFLEKKQKRAYYLSKLSFFFGVWVLVNNQSQLGVKRVEVGDKVTEVFGVQRLVGSVEDSPSTWQCYFLDNGWVHAVFVCFVCLFVFCLLSINAAFCCSLNPVWHGYDKNLLLAKLIFDCLTETFWVFNHNLTSHLYKNLLSFSFSDSLGYYGAP